MIRVTKLPRPCECINRNSCCQLFDLKIDFMRGKYPANGSLCHGSAPLQRCCNVSTCAIVSYNTSVCACLFDFSDCISYVLMRKFEDPQLYPT